MSRLIAVAFLVGLLLLGFSVLRLRVSRLQDSERFFADFLGKFNAYVEGGLSDDRLLQELTKRMDRMHREMGGRGALALYQPPFANYAHKSFAILPNLLPRLHEEVRDWALASQGATHLQMVRTALLRHAGWLEEYATVCHDELRNPVIWLREGVRLVLTSPLRVLAAFGIVSSRLTSSVAASGVLRVLGGLIALIMLIAALVTIAVGWDSAMDVLGRLIRRP